ncbi:hypothetical protein ACRRTK_008955 [Alexandromys fortis]
MALLLLICSRAAFPSMPGPLTAAGQVNSWDQFHCGSVFWFVPFVYLSCSCGHCCCHDPYTGLYWVLSAGCALTGACGRRSVGEPAVSSLGLSEVLSH